MNTLEELKSGKLKGVKKLQLAAGLTEFPTEILSLASTLEYLDLSGNQLTSLPAAFNQLQNLKVAFFSDNPFTKFPEVLGSLPKLEMIGFKACKIDTISENAFPVNLRWLILTNNILSEIPASIGHCHKLQKLMLAGNKLKALPPEMANCQNLELLRISANEFTQFPEWLFSLPRLSWLAFAGNPFNNPPVSTNNLPEISWSDLDIAEQLGQGASGVIYKANWRNDKQEQKPVAIKIFKGEVTSDGLPADEMMASLGAGTHPNLVPVLGKVSQHPEQKQGLVFDLIPASYTNLGLPPSLESCTRDCYPAGTTFSFNQLVAITKSLASVGAHLHQKGIMHGDLYAHNILINPDPESANPLFGDFGAAAVYDKSDLKRAELLVKIEVRAFGCLVEDLLNHLAKEAGSLESISYFNNLRMACMQEDIAARPNFKSIINELSLITDHDPI